MLTVPHAWFGTIVTTSPISGKRVAGGEVDVGVLLGQPPDHRVRVLDDEAERAGLEAGQRVGGERLRARVEDGVVARRPADHGRDDAQRAVLERRDAEREAAPVAVDVRADAQLGEDAALVHAVRAGRAAAADRSRRRGRGARSPREPPPASGRSPRSRGASSARRAAGPAAGRRAPPGRRPRRVTGRPCARSPCRSRRGSRSPPRAARARARGPPRRRPSRRRPSRSRASASSASRSALPVPISGNVIRMSSKPASAISSASPSFWHVSPRAPASSWSRAIRGSLCVFTCGRSARPCSSQ